MVNISESYLRVKYASAFFNYNTKRCLYTYLAETIGDGVKMALNDEAYHYNVLRLNSPSNSNDCFFHFRT